MDVPWFSAGITLALFGGVQKNSMDQNKVPVRGDIHVVVVGNFFLFFPINPIRFRHCCLWWGYALAYWVTGDPGLGKSQLLQAAAAVSPRGIYVCGNTTTKAGLTVAVVKDSMTNDYAFEAGKNKIFIASWQFFKCSCSKSCLSVAILWFSLSYRLLF